MASGNGRAAPIRSGPLGAGADYRLGLPATDKGGRARAPKDFGGAAAVYSGRGEKVRKDTSGEAPANIPHDEEVQTCLIKST